MPEDTEPRRNGLQRTSSPCAHIIAQSPDKQAFNPTEFASLFGRHRSWTYRLLYAGLLQKLDLPGRILIPSSEATRLLASKANHGGAA